MEKLDNKHATEEIKQTRNKRELIPFRDSVIEKIKKTDISLGPEGLKILNLMYQKELLLKVCF